jgi:hypothetical protein
MCRVKGYSVTDTNNVHSEITSRCEILHGSESLTPRLTLPLIVQQSKGSKSMLFDKQDYLN